MDDARGSGAPLGAYCPGCGHRNRSQEEEKEEEEIAAVSAATTATTAFSGAKDLHGGPAGHLRRWLLPERFSALLRLRF